jgi:DNA-binding SARP family transcriptional activator
LGRPAEALHHAEFFKELGHLCHSQLHERLPAFLRCQALADLGRDDEALEALDLSLPGWHEAGYRLIAAAGAMEAAQIHLRRGNLQQAHAWFETARHALPCGEELPLLHRPRSFREYLRSCLADPAPHATTSTHGHLPVWITTFGGLRIHIDGHVVSEGDWRGGSTKKVLEALIVEGGHKVPAERLADMVWPDAGTSRARDSLKVALSRLRHLGIEAGRAAPMWVQSHHGLVSLSTGICGVDALELQEAVGKSASSLERQSLIAALDLYGGDFLPGNGGETWILECRQRLRAVFIRGVHALAEAAVRHEAIDEAQGYLERALAIDPLEERTYELLMRGHLTLGRPARALRTYQEAQRTLRKDLGIEPGAPLRSLAASAAH